MQKIAGVAVLFFLGCSSTTEGPPAFQCKIGELTGTWRITYAETNGNCGPLADETAVLSASSSTAPDPCTYRTRSISSNKCSLDLDYACPLATGSGSQQWAGTLHQTAETRLTGSLSVQVAGGGVTCRSTYDVTWQRQ